MARLFLVAFLLAVVTVGAYRDVSRPEVYWHSLLPNIPIPDSIRYLFDPELNVNSSMKKQITVRKGTTVSVHIMYGHPDEESYIRSTFFPMSNLYPGTKINEGTNFTRTLWGNVFVPRPEADAIPFATNNFSKLLECFAMVPSSPEATHLKTFIQECEKPYLVGEVKFCPTSLESMIDNVVSLLETRDVGALTTTINKSKVVLAQREKVVYKTTAPIKSFPYHTKFVICHPSPSVQAVHYCHTSTMYKGYITPLIGSDGSTVDALTVCHHDSMNSNQEFFKILRLKPGSQPICHFLPENHIVWVRSDQMPVL